MAEQSPFSNCRADLSLLSFLLNPENFPILSLMPVKLCRGGYCELALNIKITTFIHGHEPLFLFKISLIKPN